MNQNAPNINKDGKRMKIYYVANARMPSEKAYAIQIAKVCESMVEAGASVEILAPIRGPKGSMKKAYHLRIDVPIRYVSVLPLYRYGRIGYFLDSLFFMFSTMAVLTAKRLKGEKFSIYTVDTDTFSYAPLVLLGVPVFIEVHDFRPSTLTTRFFFTRVTGAVATTKAGKELLEKLGTPPERITIESNGVDFSSFSTSLTKEEARKRLGLPLDEKVALYAGRFYEWKGLEILPKAFRRIPDITCVVIGGDEKEFLKVIGEQTLPRNMRIMGGKDVSEVPVWLAAADTLVIIGTRKNTSELYIAPMKVYENMATRRPIVIGETISHKNMVDENEVDFYEPDNPESLAQAVETSLSRDDSRRLERAYETALEHSWEGRTERIMSFMKRAGTVQ